MKLFTETANIIITSDHIIIIDKDLEVDFTAEILNNNSESPVFENCGLNIEGSIIYVPRKLIKKYLLKICLMIILKITKKVYIEAKNENK